MPSMTERVYPDEMDSSREIQRIIKEVFLRRYRLARDWLREHFGNRKIRIIDIASGSGFGSAILSELGETLGVDIDPESIEYANKHYRNGQLRFLIGDADDPAFLRQPRPVRRRGELGYDRACRRSNGLSRLDQEMPKSGWRLRPCLPFDLYHGLGRPSPQTGHKTAAGKLHVCLLRIRDKTAVYRREPFADSGTEKRVPGKPGASRASSETVDPLLSPPPISFCRQITSNDCGQRDPLSGSGVSAFSFSEWLKHLTEL